MYGTTTTSVNNTRDDERQATLITNGHTPRQ
jgi:hypothetical protein